MLIKNKDRFNGQLTYRFTDLPGGRSIILHVLPRLCQTTLICSCIFTTFLSAALARNPDYFPADQNPTAVDPINFTKSSLSQLPLRTVEQNFLKRSNLWSAFKNDNPLLHVYQYSVTVGDAAAYLWIPPQASRLNGAIVALSNMLERNWLEDSIIRACASKEHLAIIWVGPARQPRGDRKNVEISPDMDPKSCALLNKMFRDFAEVSGYMELANIPIIPMGHSAHGAFAWTATAWNPGRVIAAIAVKTVPLPPDLGFTDVPLCYMVGQTTEWPEFRDGRSGDRDFFWPVVRRSALDLRAKDPEQLISVVVDPGGGHFDWTERQAKFMALYIRKACVARLPRAGMKKHAKVNRWGLRPIQATDGWLTDTGGMQPDRFGAAGYNPYQGPKNKAYWFFDRELAQAAVAFEGDRKLRRKQMISFMQDGKALEVTSKGFAALDYLKLKTVRLPGDPNGFAFQLTPGYLSVVPEQLKGAGQPLSHGTGKVTFGKITGPVIQVGENTFKRRLDREAAGPIWIEAFKAGDSKYRHSVQPAQINLPATLKKGLTQQIDFPVLNNIAYKTRYVPLHGRSDAGLPVNYYVESGPAIVDELHQRLCITAIPARSRFPVKVTVTAYQWGKAVSPYYQTARPVTRTFYIAKPESGFAGIL